MSPPDLINHSGIQEITFCARHGPWKANIVSFSSQIRAGQNAPLVFKRQFLSNLWVNFDKSFFYDSLGVIRKPRISMTHSFVSIE